MDDVERTAPRKRGGQPGNRNAVKTGRHTAARKAERVRDNATLRRLRTFCRDVRAVCAMITREIEDHGRAS
jgi:hypothetical protein